MGSPNGNQVFLRKAGVTMIARSATGVPVDSNYHHIVATKNGANTAKIYIDGVESTVQVSGVQIVQDTSFLLTFGAAGSTPADYDEFAVYDRALTAAEVLGRYAGGAPPPSRSSALNTQRPGSTRSPAVSAWLDEQRLGADSERPVKVVQRRGRDSEAAGGR